MLRDLFADPPDDDGQLTFIMQISASFRAHDGFVGSDHAGVRFEEHHWLLRNGCPLFGGVIGVVAPDRNDLASGNDGCQQPDIREVVPGARVIDGHPGQRVPRYRGDGFRVLPAVDLQLDDAVGGILAGHGETGDTHTASLATETGSGREAAAVASISRRGNRTATTDGTPSLPA